MFIFNISVLNNNLLIVKYPSNKKYLVIVVRYLPGLIWYSSLGWCTMKMNHMKWQLDIFISLLNLNNNHKNYVPWKDCIIKKIFKIYAICFKIKFIINKKYYIILEYATF